MPVSCPVPLLEPLRDVLTAAERGDDQALAVLRRTLDDRPEFWEQLGDLAAQAEEAWLSLIAGSDLLFREALSRKQAELKETLGITGASALESLLIQRIAATWLQVQYADAAAAQLQSSHPAQHLLAMRRQTAAQTRLLAAIRALATVRKLLPAAKPRLLPGSSRSDPMAG